MLSGKQLKDDIRLINCNKFSILDFIKDDFYLKKYPNIKKYLFSLYYPSEQYIDTSYLIHLIIMDQGLDINIKTIKLKNKENKNDLWDRGIVGPVG